MGSFLAHTLARVFGGRELARARAFTQVPFNCWIWELVGTLLEIVQVVTGGLEGFSATPL